MILYLVRHGIAVDVGQQGVQHDADRMLSSEGREKTMEAAKGLASLGVEPDVIASSPLLRARETADLFCQACSPKKKVRIEPFLTCGARSTEVERWLKKQRAESIMLVGHMPDMAETASYFITKGGISFMAFNKAACCCIVFKRDIGPGDGRLVFHVPPKLLSKLCDPISGS